MGWEREVQEKLGIWEAQKVQLQEEARQVKAKLQAIKLGVDGFRQGRYASGKKFLT